MMKQPLAQSVEEYIALYPSATQVILNKIRALIQKLALKSEESISYGMPAYKINKKPLVYFGGYPSHIGFYPTPVGVEAFQKDFAGYKTGKGSVQFPLDKPIPYDLIEKIVLYRLDNVK